MISLDEDMVGHDGQEVIVRALKVCAGVLATLDNSTVIGAHFTNATTKESIEAMCNHMAATYCQGHRVTAMYLISNKSAWKQRRDVFKDRTPFVKYLRKTFAYNGKVLVADKAGLGQSVDIKLRQDGRISYRVTPGDECSAHATNQVGFLQARLTGPVIMPDGGMFQHKLPNDVSGFTAFGAKAFEKKS